MTLLEKIRACKSEDELDALRPELVTEMKNGKEAFEAAQKAFRTQKRKARHNDLWGQS
jgi:hypothetical protein